MSRTTPPDGLYQSVVNEKQLQEICNLIEHSAVLSIDTETSSVDAMNCDLYGVALTHKPGVAWYIPVKRMIRSFEQTSLFDVAEDYCTLEVLQKYLNPILAKNTIKVLHNAKYDLHVLRRHGFTLDGPIYDTMLAANILGNVHGGRYGLKDLVLNKMGFQMLHFEDVAGKSPFYQVPLELATKYAAADTDMTLRLRTLTEQKFEEFPALKNIRNLEMQVLPILAEMEATGCLIDKNLLVETGKTLKKSINEYIGRTYKAFGQKFNINSQPQVKELCEKIAKRKLKSVEEKDLEELARETNHEGLKLLIEYRKRYKLYSTYVVGILDKLDNDERVHTEYRQLMKTGRLSSKNPNMQNLPTLKEDVPSDWPAIRRAIIVPEGYKFVSIDYSQLELRLITHISQEPTWIEAYNNDFDVHTATAAAVFDVPMDKVTKDMRKKAKTVNFGLLYGQTPYGLSWRLGITMEEAEAFIENYFSILPMVQKYIEDRKNEVLTRRYVETPYGRRLYFKFDSHDDKAKGAAMREGINMPIQGFAADIVKTAMVGVDRYLKQTNAKSRMIIQCHDEIDFEMAEDEMELLIPRIVDIMSNAAELIIPLKVDVEIGPNWEDVK